MVRWTSLGAAKGEGNEMAQWTPKANGRVVPRRSPRPLRTDERNSPQEAKKLAIFDVLIARRHGTSINPPKAATGKEPEEWEEHEDDDEDARKIPDIEDTVDATGRLLNQQPAYDKLLNAEVRLQHGDEHGDAVQTARETRRAIGPDGVITGEYNDNPSSTPLCTTLSSPTVPSKGTQRT